MDTWNNFKLALSKYADFTSRSRRAEFWGFALISSLIGLAASSWDSWFFAEGIKLDDIIDIILFVPTIAVGARRLHDTGRSGWWQLIALTGIGLIFLIVWFAQDGEYGDNKWGRNPKAVSDEMDYSAPLNDDFDDQII